MLWLDVLFPFRCIGCDSAATSRLCARCGAADPQLSPVPPDGLRWVLSAAAYDTGVGAALRRAKYTPDRNLAGWLARWLADHTAAAAVGFDWIVPVPSPWARRLQRGFAVSAVLARAMSRASGVPTCHALTLAGGARQAGLGHALRSSNLRGRMRAIAPAPGRVLLVDDVLTTGATLAAAGRELLGETSDEVAAIVLCAASAGRVNR